MTFDPGFSENLLYPDNSLDSIVNYEVFEHAKDLEIVMNECGLVLRLSGLLLAVFHHFFNSQKHI